jgi:hypothetical protein
MYRNRARYLRVLVSLIAIIPAVHSTDASTPVPAAPGAPLASSFPGPFWDVVTPQGGNGRGLGCTSLPQRPWRQ